MRRKLIVLLAFSLGLVLETANAFAQPNFQPPTTSRIYTGYYGERGEFRRLPDGTYYTHWNLDIPGSLKDPVKASADRRGQVLQSYILFNRVFPWQDL